MTSRKALSIITSAAIFAGSVSGCSFLGGKDKAAAGDTVESYINAISKSKFNNSKKYVVDEEDYFLENEFDDETSGILSAVWSVTEYELGEVEINKNSATVEVEFTFPDLDSIADEGYSYDEFVDAIADIDDETEETFEFELSKDGDEWLIEPDSTEDFFNFLADLTKDLEFSGVTEDSAIEAVETLLAYLADGDCSSAIAMCNNLSFSFDTTGEYSSYSNYSTWESNIVSAYFSRLDYELEVTDMYEDSAVVLITGTAPDAVNAVNEAANDPDLLAPVAADYIEAVLNQTVDFNVLSGSLIDIVVDAINGAGTTSYSHNVVVSASEDGRLVLTPDPGLMQNLVIPDFINGEEVVPAAVQLLYDQGRISAEQYAQLIGESGTSGYDVTTVVGYAGEDLYDYNVFVNEDVVSVHFQTWGYYDEGDTFEYEVTIDGSEVIQGEYVIPFDNCDIIEVDVPVGASGPYGNYVFVCYDEGSSSSELGEIEVIVLADGAPVLDGITATMDIIEEGDDLYSNYTETDSDSVTVYVRTWDYYDQGTEFDYVIMYMSGTMQVSVGDTYVMPNDHCDTIIIDLPQVGGTFQDEYDLVVYDANTRSSVLGEFVITVD